MKIDKSTLAISLIEKIDGLKNINDEFGILKRSFKLLTPLKTRISYTPIILSPTLLAKYDEFDLSTVKKIDSDEIFDNCALVIKNVTILIVNDYENNRILINTIGNNDLRNIVLSCYINKKDPSKISKSKGSSDEILKETLQIIFSVFQLNKTLPLTVVNPSTKILSASDNFYIKNNSKKMVYALI